VQIIFASKAHPRDEPGKVLIREIVHLARQPEFRRRIVFLEDYDHVIARYLVSGVDVWVNTPRRPLEASGTSGMKASFNGALNLSVLDGWWDEGYSDRTGWAIGKGEEYTDTEYQDRVEAGALYEVLEREVVPLFYTRGADRLPRGWIALMKSAMGELCPVFNTNRMVHQYYVQSYAPALPRRVRLEDDGCRRARELSRWKARVRAAWGALRVAHVDVDLPEQTTIGKTFQVKAWVKSGGLSPDELAVQVWIGRLRENRQIGDPDLRVAAHGERSDRSIVNARIGAT
jgi:starch phosphorylase